jgi:hypothetical protein
LAGSVDEFIDNVLVSPLFSALSPFSALMSVLEAGEFMVWSWYEVLVESVVVRVLA